MSWTATRAQKALKKRKQKTRGEKYPDVVALAAELVWRELNEEQQGATRPNN